MEIKGKIREVYQEPIVEVIIFTIGDSIAASTNFGSGTICGEEVKG